MGKRIFIYLDLKRKGKSTKYKPDQRKTANKLENRNKLGAESTKGPTLPS